MTFSVSFVKIDWFDFKLIWLCAHDETLFS
jgi:hypothetical protein